jgi:hypothetical protein
LDNQRSWAIIGVNLGKLVEVMLTVQKGASVDVFCDSTGANLSIAETSGTATIKLCSVTAPELEDHYGVKPRGDGFTNDDGEAIPREQLPAYLVQYITGAKDGGAEWGWEFKVSGAD